MERSVLALMAWGDLGFARFLGAGCSAARQAIPGFPRGRALGLSVSFSPLTPPIAPIDQDTRREAFSPLPHPTDEVSAHCPTEATIASLRPLDHLAALILHTCPSSPRPSAGFTPPQRPFTPHMLQTGPTEPEPPIWAVYLGLRQNRGPRMRPNERRGVGLTIDTWARESFKPVGKAR